MLEANNWHIDIDKHLNPYVPENRISRLPKPVSRFLGYRDSPRKEIGNLLVAVWSFLGAFIGVMVIEAVFMIPAIHDRGVPILIASFVRKPSGPLAVLTAQRVRQRSLNTTQSNLL